MHYLRWYRQQPHPPRITHHAELTALVLAATGEGCILWHRTLNAYGYGVVRLGGQMVRAHVVACTLAHGPRPAGHQAAHCQPDGSPCVSRACVNPLHLRWATPWENEQDKRQHGTSLSRLTEDQVRDIRRLHLAGVSIHQLARSFGVACGSIRPIVRRRTWAWLSEA